MCGQDQTFGLSSFTSLKTVLVKIVLNLFCVFIKLISKQIQDLNPNKDLNNYSCAVSNQLQDTLYIYMTFFTNQKKEAVRNKIMGRIRFKDRVYVRVKTKVKGCFFSFKVYIYIKALITIKSMSMHDAPYHSCSTNCRRYRIHPVSIYPFLALTLLREARISTLGA